ERHHTAPAAANQMTVNFNHERRSSETPAMLRIASHSPSTHRPVTPPYTPITPSISSNRKFRSSTGAARAATSVPAAERPSSHGNQKSPPWRENIIIIHQPPVANP